ncbi:hypothetical protein DBR43_33125, partial [Pedobacter sp. KBW06]
MAAGAAGVIKILLSLKNQLIPPTINYENTNPLIDLSDSPFKIQDKPEVWASDVEHPRRAAVSSFGFSGTNAHIVIEEYPAKNKPSYTSDAGVTIVLSARNQERLQQYAGDLKKHLLSVPALSLHDVAYTLQIGREAMEERFAVAVNQITDLITELTNFLTGHTGTFFTGSVKKNRTDRHDVNGQSEAELARLWVSGVLVDWEAL